MLPHCSELRYAFNNNLHSVIEIIIYRSRLLSVNLDSAALSVINCCLYIQSDSTLLSGFPFIGRGNPDNNLESRYYNASSYFHL
jgi:hypothetical protein